MHRSFAAHRSTAIKTGARAPLFPSPTEIGERGN
jgi:hypothetical protein